MGTSGIIAQIVLLRELLVSFYGNELTLGIILANWLVLVAIGSYIIGRSVERVKRKLEIYAGLQLIFSVAFPAALYFSRIFRTILLPTQGEAFGFGTIFYSSFLVLLPVATSNGALFTYGSKLYSQYLKEDASSVGKVYSIETIGAILGGVGATYALIPYLNAFEIAFILSLINSLISAVLLWPVPERLHIPSRAGLWIVSLLLSLLYATSLLSSAAKELDWFSVQSRWRGMEVVDNENSVYGNIAVIQSGEQFTFFTNGVPTITTPVPDVAFIEDLVHFPMLIHESPRSVLILGGGAGGMMHEILKHPVDRVDYVELDPLLLKLVGRFSTPLTQSELSNPKVRVHYVDSRFFILKTSDRFDVIFIGVAAPQDLRTNRLFSREFFSFAKQRMNPGGILVLFLPGSLTYVSKELGDLNACISGTLKKVFPWVKTVPGEGINLYLASNSDKLLIKTANEMYKHLQARKVETKLITQSYLEYRLHDRWQEWFLQSMVGRTAGINSDFHPLGVFFSLSYWNALFSPYLIDIFKRFERFDLLLPAILLGFFPLGMVLFFIKRPHVSIHSVPFAIFTTGLSGLIFNLAIIFAFQTAYGYLYHQVGLLIGILMMGIALGSLVMTARLKAIHRESALFLGTEFGIILFSVLLPLVFFALSGPLQASSTKVLFQASFCGTSFVSGMLVGFQFPLAIEIYCKQSPTRGALGRTAGLIYGVDLLGGFLGGLLGGVLFLPVLGLKETCYLMAMIKISSFLLFLAFMRVHPSRSL